ncbi:unnamed protein product [Bursaphelenchus xylophilus]|uniref:(pine wood nematode) hypothetical protein n=1 Tax=Bursaphelenchus xylophilus TaxID=6326 RepID=A0A1I7RR28_BURXY|nr:unnamed protein product [Bursaphelenchus xylophilus]CAG9130820.1 unnamed protein product [Bursaphelenchus xylophilus]
MVSHLIPFFLFIIVVAKKGPADTPIDITKEHSPEAQCHFSVHEKTHDGPEVTGTNLHQELYYKIQCKSEKGYCLFVSNCTVSTGNEKPYEIIDGNGCTTEPSLFEHVKYLDDSTAGIYNPFPIRFRNQNSAVRFQCSTKLRLRETEGYCERPACTANEYSEGANFHKHE